MNGAEIGTWLERGHKSKSLSAKSEDEEKEGEGEGEWFSRFPAPSPEDISICGRSLAAVVVLYILSRCRRHRCAICRGVKEVETE